MRDISQLYVRLPEDLHTKLRVLAALNKASLNTTMIAASTKYIKDWEAVHGVLPTLPQGD